LVGHHQIGLAVAIQVTNYDPGWPSTTGAIGYRRQEAAVAFAEQNSN
jgi:hypothetical protein